MARGATATVLSNKDDQDNSHSQEAKASKRRCVQSACVPCRKRKSKVSMPIPNNTYPGVGTFASAEQPTVLNLFSLLVPPIFPMMTVDTSPTV
jgi:hypothetical protein